MTRPQPRLCIGGTNDGRRCTALRASVVRLPRRLNVARGADSSPSYDNDAVDFTSAIEDYRAFDHGLGGRKFSVWVPSEWSDEQAATEVFGRIAKMWSGVVGDPAASDLERFLVEQAAEMMAKEEAEAARRFIEGDGKPLPRGIMEDQS